LTRLLYRSLRPKKSERQNGRRTLRRDLPNGEVIWITPEFALMSRGGRRGRGIAAEWLAKYSADVYPPTTSSTTAENSATGATSTNYSSSGTRSHSLKSNYSANTAQRNSPRTTPRQDGG